ncbi:MAG: ABC transporter ATP-binding protein [Rhodocyclaceae bacterium]|nr:ABC transporter ATP-binding protein [Rhodocyclaceae bacterium]
MPESGLASTPRRLGGEDALLRVTDLSVTIGGTTPVDGISFDIAPGETFALLGESGSGKSMTALALMRLLPNVARIVGGAVQLGGRDLLALPEYDMRTVRGGGMAMIFQEPATSLNPVMTVGRQIAEALSLHGQATRPTPHPPHRSGGDGGSPLRGSGPLAGLALGRPGGEAERALELLAAVGIPDPRRRLAEYPFQLSGGMKQRVMIAMALAGNPQLLIADEPTTALDVTIQAQVLDLLKNLQRSRGMAMLLITHDLGVAARMADHVGVMNDGRLVEVATRAAFFRAPAHAYSQRLFAALPENLAKPPAKPPAHDALLDVAGLKVHFPIRRGLLQRAVGHVKAVDGVALSLRAGRTLALVGESGCGKTTAGKAILRLIQPTAGTVQLGGRTLDAKSMAAARGSAQMVFQDPFGSLNPRLRIGPILAEGMRALGISGDHAARIAELLAEVGLTRDMAGRYPHEFSGGQRQRIAIARALAVAPRLLILDEPTSALDVSVQAQILKLLAELQRNLGLGYLFITHNIAVVDYLADEVAVMYLGRIVERGTTAQVLRGARHPYTQALLAAVPRIDGAAGERLLVPGDPPSPADPPSGCHFHPRCPRATEICRRDYPGPTALAAEHVVHCWHADD